MIVELFYKGSIDLSPAHRHARQFTIQVDYSSGKKTSTWLVTDHAVVSSLSGVFIQDWQKNKQTKFIKKNKRICKAWPLANGPLKWKQPLKGTFLKNSSLISQNLLRISVLFKNGLLINTGSEDSLYSPVLNHNDQWSYYNHFSQNTSVSTSHWKEVFEPT